MQYHQLMKVPHLQIILLLLLLKLMIDLEWQHVMQVVFANKLIQNVLNVTSVPDVDKKKVLKSFKDLSVNV